MMKHFKDFLKDESGATAVDYGLIAAVMSVATIVALQFMGTSLRLIFNVIGSELNGATST